LCESQNQHHSAGHELGSGRRAFGPADAACGGVQGENDCEYDRGGTEYGAHESPFAGVEVLQAVGGAWAKFKSQFLQWIHLWARCTAGSISFVRVEPRDSPCPMRS